MDDVLLVFVVIIVFVGSFNTKQAKINRLSFWLNGNMNDFNSGIDLVFIINWLLSPKVRAAYKKEREIAKREENIEQLYRELKREEEMERKAKYIQDRMGLK